MDTEQLSEEIAIRVHDIVNDERKRNPNGDYISVIADGEIDDLQEHIENLLTSSSKEGKVSEFENMTQEDRELWWADLVTSAVHGLSFSNDKSFDEFRDFVSIIEHALDV